MKLHMVGCSNFKKHERLGQHSCLATYFASFDLGTIGKILEKLMYSRIYNFFFDKVQNF